MGMTGAYERNLDAKGRLSLPAPLREELGEHVRVFKALDVDALYVFSAEAFDKWVEGLFAGREGHEGFNPRDINDQKLMRAINKRTTSMDVDSAGRIGLSESLRKQANLDREVTVVGNTLRFGTALRPMRTMTTRPCWTSSSRKGKARVTDGAWDLDTRISA